MAFPSTYLAVTVELALGADLSAAPSTWAWTDVTDYVRTNGIRVTRGGFDGSVQSPPSRCDFYADNRDGRWSPTNPTGAWYGTIGKGTPVRVKTAEGSTSVRWTGFLVELPPRWNLKETDRFVPVVAAGVLRRLERGQTPLRTALTRAISGTRNPPSIAGTLTPPVAYWPGEDGSTSTSIAEYFGGRPMDILGQVLTLSSDGPSGSLPLPEFTTVAGVVGTVPSHNATGAWSVAKVFKFPAVPPSETIIFQWFTTGTYPQWRLTLTPGSPDAVALQAFDSSLTMQINDSVGFLDEWYGRWILLMAGVTQDGADVDYWFAVADADDNGGVGQTGTESAITAGTVTRLREHANSKIDGMHAGHWAAWDIDIDFFGLGVLNPDALSGFDGDDVTDRVGRISQESPPIESVEQMELDQANRMGPQPQSTLLGLYRECEAVTNGRLVESRDPTTFNTFMQLYMHDALANQDTALTLNHDSGHLSPPFEPTDDDQQLRNDVTATRSGASGIGSEARVVATEGEHGSLTPANVGTYNDSVSVNVYTDDDLPHQAGWRVHIGTHEGPRFPAVTLDFARNPSLIASWITCDIGSRITITNPPEGIAPDSIDLLIEGWTEVFGPKTWQVQLNCSPYKPWHVFRLAETSGDTNVYLGRLAEDENCALRVAVSSSATSFLVDPNRYRWTTAADDFPLNIRLGGEVCTLSAIATTAVTFVGVGTATHGSNASVTPGFPAGTTTNDVLMVFAAIRNSGTGTVNTPTGYTRLPVFDAATNVGLFAKVDGGSEVAPEVSFTDGVANATTSAVMFAFRGLPISLEDLGDMVVDHVDQLNASAANIAYGGLYSWKVAGCVQLILAWKQDDFTSIAVPSGFTEMIEASSTTGDDQSLYIAYRIDTTPAVVNDSSLVVTGGASAISRSAVVALAGGFQTFTVSARSVNGVTKSHAAGTKVAVDDPSVLAL
jgi:hypothetical protein